MSTSAHASVTEREGIPLVAVEGEVDIANVAELRAQILQAAPSSVPGLVLDLSRTSYLDSRGVHLLLELADRLAIRQQQLRIVVPDGALVRRVLLLTHVDATVVLDGSVDDAITALRPTPARSQGSEADRGSDARR